MKLLTQLVLAAAVLSQCPGADLLCSHCEGVRCQFCMSSYTDLYGKCIEVPTVKVKNCFVYYGSGKCVTCEPGFQLDEDMQCNKIELAGCEELDRPKNCAVCANSTLAVNGTCASASRCSVTNCARCDANDRCVDCAAGFYRSVGGKCVAETSQLVNCRWANVDNECVACKREFYDKNGTCTTVKGAGLVKAMAALLGVLALLAA